MSNSKDFFFHTWIFCLLSLWSLASTSYFLWISLIITLIVLKVRFSQIVLLCAVLSVFIFKEESAKSLRAEIRPSFEILQSFSLEKRAAWKPPSDRGVAYTEKQKVSKVEAWRAALFKGELSHLSPKLMDALKYLGLFHLFVLSAFHLAFVLKALSKSRVLFSLFCQKPLGGLSFVLELTGFALLIFYILQFQFGIAPWRSLSVALLLTLGMRWIPFLYRYGSSERLMILALVFLFMDISYVFSLGYLLSFGMSWILLRSQNPWEAFMASGIGSQCLLSLFGFPTSALTVLWNFLFTPFFTFLGLPALAFDCSYTRGLIQFLETAVLGMYDWAAQMRLHSSSSIFICSGVLVLLYVGLRIKRWRIWLFCVCQGMLLFSPAFFAPSHSLTFFDVGQGDAVLISTKGKRILIDGGDNSILLSKLFRENALEIDLWVLTHFDRDHSENFARFSPLIRAKELWVPLWDGTEKSKELQKKASFINRVAQVQITQSQSWSYKDVSFRCVNFPSGGREVKNNDSLACQLRQGHRLLFVFSGDLEISGEKRILRRQSFGSEPTEILMAGHHGSATSTSHQWLMHFPARYVVISAGRNNRYDFPKSNVLDRIKRTNATILRVDALGDIRFHWPSTPVD